MKRTKNPAKEAEYRKRAADLVAQMTLHEKVSQMLSWAPAIERLGIPAYNWWSVEHHGVAGGSGLCRDLLYRRRRYYHHQNG